jgi:hypothetical protein
VKLFLAQIRLTHHSYMSDSREEDTTRLVWADDEDSASEKIIRVLSIDVPYSHSTDVTVWDINEAIA